MRALDGFVAGLALGAAIALAATRARPGAEPAPLTHEEATPADATGAETASRDAPTATSIAAQPAAEAVHERIAQAIAATTYPLPASATAVLEGLVEDADGKPIASARVQCWPNSPYSYRRRDESENDLAVAIQAEIADNARMHALHREATTDAAGRFALTAVPAGRYYVSTEPEGYREAGDSFETGAPIKLVCAVEVAVDVDVRLEDGSPPQQAYLIADRGLGRFGWPESRRMFLAPGLHELVATDVNDGGTRRGPAALRSDIASFRLERGVPARVSLTMRARPLLRIHVTTSDREPLPERLSNAWARLPEGKGPDLDWLARVGRTESVDESGEFSTTDLVAGTHFIALWENGEPVDQAVVNVAEGPCDLTLTVPPLDPARTVLLRVFGHDGSGILGNPSVYAHAGDATWGVQQTRSGWRLRGPRLAPPRPEGAPLTVQVVATGLGVAELVVPPHAAEVTLRFEEPALLDITVTDCPPDDLGSVFAMLVRDPMSYEGGTAEADGLLRLKGLQPGRYDLVVSADQLPIARIPLDLHSGSNSVTISAPLYEVTVKGPTEGAFLIRPEKDLQASSSRSAASAPGDTILPHLPAGTYRLELHPRDAAQPASAMRFTVPGPAEFPFVADPALASDR